MNDALTVGLSQAGADLARDLAGFLFRYRAVAVDALGEGLPLDELHREEVEVSEFRGGGMQVVDLADVEMADLAGGAGLGRKTVAVAELGALERDAPVELLVDGLEDDAHAAEADLADDAEAIVQEVARASAGRAGGPLDQRFQKEPAHTLLPLDAAADLFVDRGIAADGAQAFFAFRWEESGGFPPRAT